VMSLLLAFVATLYPSWRAARVNPAEALRYE
jgi:lipoprotein-releasing system permease protein